MIKLGKYRKTKTLINNTLQHDFKNGIHMITPNNYLLIKVSNVQKKIIFCLRVCRYKTVSFRGYFLGARAVLDILFLFAPGMESGRKNECFILDLLMRFKVSLKSSPIHFCILEGGGYYELGTPQFPLEILHIHPPQKARLLIEKNERVIHFDDITWRTCPCLGQGGIIIKKNLLRD